eukprot:COSAG01_NODE_63232_length_280_cov_327.049724_1_plen_62_part_10
MLLLPAAAWLKRRSAEPGPLLRADAPTRFVLRLMLPTADVPAILPVPLQQAHYGVEDTLMQW